MSVVLATPGSFAGVHTTVAALTAQTARDRLELVLVTPRRAVLQPDGAVLGAFGWHQVVEVADFGSLGPANAAGVRAARAPIVALAEDHCFPDPDWAQHLISAHEGPWAAVGPAVRNANPATALSWADLFIGYGPWLEPVTGGEVAFLPGHNSSYKRDVLLSYGDRLDELLTSETVLHWDMRARGQRLRLEPAARVRHTNFSLWSSWLPVQFLNGLVFAGERRKGMSTLRRVTYVLGAALIPWVRLARLLPAARRRGLRVAFVRALPALVVGLHVDSAGQMVGYALGARDTPAHLARFECHRVQHVTERDRREVFAS